VLGANLPGALTISPMELLPGNSFPRKTCRLRKCMRNAIGKQGSAVAKSIGQSR